MSAYHDGRRIEYAVIRQLEADGYKVSRAASSKGPFGDVIAGKQGQFLFINVKKKTPPGPEERAQLLAVAALLPGVAVPLVALGPASRLTYRKLTGSGAQDYVPWTPDVVGGAA